MTRDQVITELRAIHSLFQMPSHRQTKYVEALAVALDLLRADPSAQRRRDFEAGLTVECDGRLSDGRWEFNGQIYETRDGLVAAYLNE